VFAVLREKEREIWVDYKKLIGKVTKVSRGGGWVP
jgi:hypothetical protein